MPISVVCQCGAKLNAKDELAGKTVKCPKCSQPLKISAAASAASSAAPAKPSAPKTAPATTQPKPTKPKPQPPEKQPDAGGSLWDEIGLAAAPKADITCPKCGAGMKEGAIICIHCGFNTQTGKQLSRTSDSEALERREDYYAQQAAKATVKEKKVRRSSSSGDGSAAEFSALDYVVSIICPGIGLICGVVYCVTGNPKGPKMLGLSIIFVLLWNVVRWVILPAMQTPAMP